MAWLDTVTKDGKKYLRIGFKLPGHTGKLREPLGLEDNRRNRARARERVQKAIEHEIATGTFDYAKRFPDSPRVKPGIADGRADHVGRAEGAEVVHRMPNYCPTRQIHKESGRHLVRKMKLTT